MVYLAKAENEEIIFTHKMIIGATIKKGSPEDIEKFIRDKIKKWGKVNIESINFKVEVIIHTSEPNLFSTGTIIPPVHSPDTMVVASSYLLRPLKAIANEASLYLWHPDLKLPDGIEIKEMIPEVKVEQILFPEKLTGEKFVILR